jgi:PTS system ascorbate-specific IIA component
MSVGIVVVTHGGTAESLIAEAGFILGQDLSDVLSVHFNEFSDLAGGLAEIRAALDRADRSDGVIVLSDLIGASPSNGVTELLDEYQAVMVTGVNLAMLLSVWNYRDKALVLVARKAVEGGRRGVKIFQK